MKKQSMSDDQTYTPSQKTLDRYARLMVRFAAGNGKGIKRGDVVHLIATEVAKPLYFAIKKEIVAAGGHVISQYMPNDSQEYNFARSFYEGATPQQLDFFPEKYYKGLIDSVDHMIYIIADVDKEALKGVDAKKVMRKGLAAQPYSDWRQKKESAGEFSWTLCLYGTDQSAAVVDLTPQQYWREIIKACYLDEEDPVKKWKSLYRDLEKYRQKMNRITAKTEKFHMVGKDMDLWITPGEGRQWLAGRGANIPSFEIFTSPDWRGTEGWIYFNHPLYRYGNIIKGIKLEFKNGKVVSSSAEQGADVVQHMIATKNADKVGEFSLTDKRFSRITKPMGETLYDENMGGKYGNTHIAVGKSFHDAYVPGASKVTKKKAEQLGFNNSSVHTDIISTTNRTVTAHLKDGTEKVIYENGMFVL